MAELEISKEELLKELNLELAYHSEGGSTYRSETTRYSLNVATSLPDTQLFFNRDDTYVEVKLLYPELDEDRLRDVSKMLSVITRDLYRKKTMTPELKAFLEDRRRNRKPLRLL